MLENTESRRMHEKEGIKRLPQRKEMAQTLSKVEARDIAAEILGNEGICHEKPLLLIMKSQWPTDRAQGNPHGSQVGLTL